MNVAHRDYSGLQGLTRWDLPTRGYLTHLPSSANQQSHSDSTDLKNRNDATSYLNPEWTADRPLPIALGTSSSQVAIHQSGKDNLNLHAAQ